MHISLNQYQLNKALSPLASIATNKKSLPILRNVLLRCDNGVLKITASDSEVELTKEIEIDSSESFAITVEAQKFTSLVATLPSDADVKLKVDGSKVRLTSGRSRFVLATLPAQDFPFIDMDNSQGEVGIPVSDLQANIERTAFAVASGDVRPALNGMLFSFNDRNLTNVATNGLRMAVNKTQIEGSANFEAIIAKKAIEQIKRFENSNNAMAVIQDRGNVLSFTAPGTTLNCTMIDAKFPEFKRVIPSSFTRSVVVDKASFVSSIKRAMILADDKTGLARLQVRSESEISVMAKSVTDSDTEFTDEIDAQAIGGAFEIGFKASFMMDALSHIKNETVILQMNNANDAIQASATLDEPASLFIVMPIHL